MKHNTAILFIRCSVTNSSPKQELLHAAAVMVHIGSDIILWQIIKIFSYYYTLLENVEKNKQENGLLKRNG